MILDHPPAPGPDYWDWRSTWVRATVLLVCGISSRRTQKSCSKRLPASTMTAPGIASPNAPKSERASRCEVVITHIDGKDVVRFYKTSGSNGHGSRELIAEFSE
ncbi:hypothetical protein [Mycobacterium timonense]|uniref:hypothetical protein n=1 Tax=Mycobacterium timonense TaxID=701043 RepID=UPI00114D77D3|nr:hypothetical protein [Mycobacterium timonense]